MLPHDINKVNFYRLLLFEYFPVNPAKKIIYQPDQAREPNDRKQVISYSITIKVHTSNSYLDHNKCKIIHGKLQSLIK